MTLVQLGACIAMHFWRFVQVGDSPFTKRTNPTDSVSRKLCHLRPRAVGGRLAMKVSSLRQSFLLVSTALEAMSGRQILLWTFELV